VRVAHICDLFFCDLFECFSWGLFVEECEIVSDEFVEVASAEVQVLVVGEEGVAFEDGHDLDAAVACGDDCAGVAAGEIEWGHAAECQLYFVDF
jgi:hypothetical protein